EVPLECGYNQPRGIIVKPRNLQPVAELDQLFLKILDRSAAVVRRKRAAFRDRRRIDPEADTGGGELRPGEFLARILLARRCDIGVRQHAFARNVTPLDDVAAKLDDGVDLRVGKIAVAELVTRVDDFDADRARVDVNGAS